LSFLQKKVCVGKPHTPIWFGTGNYKNADPLREFARNNIPVLRRIFVRIEGATMGAYCDIRVLRATHNTDKKTSKTGVFVFATSLVLVRPDPSPLFLF
jgi:hypothetical protein